jgi:NAD(P)H-hydrate epimerase
MPFPPISIAQMREVDRLMVEEYGITLLQMMENAGRSLAAAARHELGGKTAPSHVVVLVGAGNNGGGGLVAGRHLANAGAEVMVLLSQPPPLPGAIPEHQRYILERMGIPGSDQASPLEALPALLAQADLVLDSLIGYSLRGAPHEPVASMIRAANAASAPRLALDLPSGLAGDQGISAAPTIQATLTLTLAWPKAGLLTPAARPYVGNLLLADISDPAAVYRAVGVERGNLFAEGPLVRVRPVAAGWEAEALPGDAVFFL